VIFVEVAVVTGLLPQLAGLASLAPGYHTTTTADADVDEQPPRQICRAPMACR
jgi:hypothetical protein